MSPTLSPFEVPEIQNDGGLLVMPVAWKHAEGLQNRLKEQGIGSTLCWIPYTNEARLEFWPGTDAASVRAALALSGDGAPRTIATGRD